MSVEIGAVDAAIDALNAYLATISGLTVLTEWPAANHKMVYPSVTCTTGVAKRTPIQPETIAVGTPNEMNQIVETLCIGHYDIPVQLDLWCRTKAERRQFTNAVLNAFNLAAITDSAPVGLSLELTNYFNIFARYEIDTHEFRDDEVAVERQERRCRFSLLVNTREIVQRTMYAITQGISISQQVAGGNAPLTDDTSGTESKVIS